MAIQQFNPPHPGELIYRTYIEPYADVTATSVARELGVSRQGLAKLMARLGLRDAAGPREVRRE